VDEFWVCQHCRSLNRAGTSRCYHCRQKFGSRPQDAAPIVRNAAAAASAPLPVGPGSGLPGGSRAGTAAGAASFGYPIGAAAQAGELPAYLSRPVALAPAPVRDFSAPTLEAKPRREFHRPQLTGWIRRRVAWSLTTRPFVPVRLLGYASAVLLTLLLLSGALIVTTVTPVARVALQSGSLSTAWDQVDPGYRWTLELMVAVFAVVGALALASFSVFVGFSTHNGPGLGAEKPLLTPYHAGTAWLAVLWAQLRLAVALLLPATLIWMGYVLPGLIAALVAVELAQRRLDGAFDWLSNPARHLPDLFTKLGVSGSSGSPLGSAWAFCFRAANLLALVLYALPMLTVVAIAVAAVAGRSDLLAWRSSGYGPIQLSIAVVVVLLIMATSGAIGLLVPISVEFVERQKTRQTLVRVGRSRPWIAGPGNLTAAATDTRSARWDPYERHEEEPDQASLYSPSTTSSFPWEAPSDDAPPD
jgi:hypothetical protein